MSPRIAIAAGVMALALGCAAAFAGTPPGNGSGDFRLSPVANFDQPMYVHGPPGGKGLLFVVEREGTIEVRKGGRSRGTFLNIKGLVRCCDGERGLLSVAFANWRKSRRFYVYFTDAQGDLRISEFRRKRTQPLRASPKSRRDLLEIRHRAESNHNGGQLQWGPDGNLYIGTGDGGGGGDPQENAQDRSSLLGKLLRIDPIRKKRRYGIPKGNPYANGKGQDEIFSRGLRNPWRFSFDRTRIAIGDVGQDAIEEVDFETVRGARGANFGWDNYEGNALYEGPALANHDRPIHTYSSASAGRCSITGGYVVRDRDLPGLYGRYLYGDLCTGEIRSVIPRTSGARDDQGTGLGQGGLVSFGTDAAKDVYVAAGNTVYRVVAD